MVQSENIEPNLLPTFLYYNSDTLLRGINMTYVFHRYGYKGSLDRLKTYKSLVDVRAACVKKMRADMKGPSRVSGIYVIRKETEGFNGSYFGVVGWMAGERTADRKKVEYAFYTGKGGFMGEAGKIRVGVNGQTYKLNINRNIASPYNRKKKTKKSDNDYGIKGDWKPFGL